VIRQLVDDHFYELLGATAWYLFVDGVVSLVWMSLDLFAIKVIGFIYWAAHALAALFFAQAVNCVWKYFSSIDPRFKNG
jgi:hypothetical protein